MNEDPQLKQILGTWQVSPPPAPEFNSSVWRRIDAGEERALVRVWTTLRDWLFVQLPKPAYAAAVLTLTAVFGGTLANVRASHMRDQYRLESARHYLASIDPLTMNASRPPASR